MEIHSIQEIKIKWFQMRIVRRIMETNVVLKEMRLVNSFCCDFCLETKDNIDHKLYSGSVCTLKDSGERWRNC